LGGGDWRYSFAFDGQMSGDSLISGEQFGAGGIYSVRGFEERVISADSGARLSLELMSGNRNAWVKDWLPRLNFVAFLEGARLGLNSPPPGVKDEPGISSVGGGIRFAFVPAHQFKLDVARVLSGIPTQPSGETMVHFSFVTSLQ
jgi:hemolysin activation/secretion protein